MQLDAMQSALAATDLDGWLLYDFRGLNPIARRLAGFSDDAHLTRRWFGWVPRTGAPRWLCHAIEEQPFAPLPGERRSFVSWRELEAGLRWLLDGSRRVAMEYSPRNAIPYVARVDAGTVEWVRSLGVEVATSADLVSAVEARWDEAGLASHRRAALQLTEAVRELHAGVAARLGAGERPAEHEVQADLSRDLRRRGLVWEGDLIVAVGTHSANPHHAPSLDARALLEPGQVLLVDLWGRLDGPGTVSADITWMAYLGATVPEEVQRIWDAVAGARDAAVEFLARRFREGRPVRGYEVDDVARGYLEERGLARHFLHRLGHSIGVAVHGNGANLDHLETQDERLLLPGTGFSVEPGVYLTGRFGVRSEIDVYWGSGGPEVTTPPQRALPALLA